MSHTKRHIRLFIWFPVVTLVVGVGFWFWSEYGNNPYSARPTTFGTTFSTKYAKELGLDWQAAYMATIDDLGVKHLRIPVYWDEIEAERGVYNLQPVEWMLSEAAARDVSVTLAIGNRVPRWPECHPPVWTVNLPPAEFNAAEQAMIEHVVTQFAQAPALVRWQVENEPFFASFGECLPMDKQHLGSLIQRVHELDGQHPVMVTESGELSSWVTAADLADVLGVSMYRVTWNSFWGYFHYPLPPSHYVAKAQLVSPLVDEVIVSELQMEPWTPAPIAITPLEEQFHSMNPDRILGNIDYARRTGFAEVYLWGTEWWYWLKVVKNEPEIWELGRTIFDGSAFEAR